MDAFEALLAEHRGSIERLVKFRLPSNPDAEDILQEIWLTACKSFHTLRDPARFRPWIFQIARNRCNDYYRERAKNAADPIEALPESHFSDRCPGRGAAEAVLETLDRLPARDRELLKLIYFHGLPQVEAAQRLGIPVGTVKSRLHSAKQRFRSAYPFPPRPKGESNMKTLPKIMPEYTLEWSSEPPFPVRWEELMGWFIIPRVDERLCWAMYDFPERIMTESVEMQVIGRAMVHGVEGVEIRSVEKNPMECNSAGGQSQVERTFIAQLTDTHCRALAESHMENGVRCNYTFLDGDSFLNNWGFGEDNCGNEIDIRPKGDILRDGSNVTTADKTFLLDVVGRCTVTLAGKRYDTVCVMDVDTYNSGAATEQFLDANGRTVLWRRFNPDDWKIEKYGLRWSERFPDNDRLCVNGRIYVHWYDCLTDYVL